MHDPYLLLPTTMIEAMAPMALLVLLPTPFSPPSPLLSLKHDSSWPFDRVGSVGICLGLRCVHMIGKRVVFPKVVRGLLFPPMYPLIVIVGSGHDRVGS